MSTLIHILEVVGIVVLWLASVGLAYRMGRRDERTRGLRPATSVDKIIDHADGHHS